MDESIIQEARPQKLLATSALLALVTLGWLTFAARDGRTANAGSHPRLEGPRAEAAGQSDRAASTTIEYPALDRLIARLAAEARNARVADVSHSQ